MRDERSSADATTDAAPGWRRWSWLLPPVVLAVFGGWLLSRRYSFWYDELFTAEMVRVPFGDLVHAVVRGEGTIPYLGDAPPSYNGPYYAVAHLWLLATGLAPDEWGLRLLSLLAAVAAVAAFTLAVGRLARPDVGLVAGLTVATNPFVIEYAAEARGYGLALLATALAALGLQRWLDDRPRGLLLYGLAGAMAGLAHWFALLVLAAFAVAAVCLRGRRALPLLATSGAAAVPALVVVGMAVANGVGGSGAEWIADVGLAVPRLLLRSWASERLALAVVTVVAAAVGVVAGRRHRRAWVVGVAWVGLPVAAVSLAELVRPVYVDRYLLPAVLGLAVLVGLGVTAMRGRARGVAAAAVVVVSAAVTVGAGGQGPKEDVRGAVAALATLHRPGEPVVAAARWDALGVDQYARREHPVLLADLVLPPAAAPAAPTVWVVRRAEGGVKGDRTRLAALDEELAAREMRVAEERRFTGRYADVLLQRWVASSADAGRPRPAPSG
ncbi:MAG TPA: glycosyltransferase family 39 protein [Acidimicrobiales bacterium]|nr:glycosyltransferase family 39 protein [Acidimicrobiales bacterium]